MEDLKIVFYIVVAIIWMVYNNYRKISEKDKKRDPSKPPQEVIPENWPKEIFTPKKEPVVPKQESYQRSSGKKLKPVTVPDPYITKKKEILKREPIRKERISANYKFKQPATTTKEGGNLQPSKIVQFQDAELQPDSVNTIADQIRNADFRSAIVLAEVLQRPYI